MFKLRLDWKLALLPLSLVGMIAFSLVTWPLWIGLKEERKEDVEGDKMKDKFEAFKEAYDHFPSQDNEGYIPERGSFKTGFITGWDACKSELMSEIDALEKVLLDRDYWREQFVKLDSDRACHAYELEKRK